jgi:diacylglycerol kinase (ATP)
MSELPKDRSDLAGTTGTRRRALLIANRQSRRGRESLASALAHLDVAGFAVEQHECARAGDLSELIISRQNEADCVILAGGDGTMNAAARGLVATGLPLGILPSGTANDLARTLGIPDDLVAAAGIIAAGRIIDIDVGQVNGHFFFNVASVGLSAQLAQRLTPEIKRRFGRLSYAFAAAKALFDARPFHAILFVDGDRVRVKTMQIAVGNGHFYGGGTVVAWDARIDDGQLNLYSLEFSRVWRMALLLRTFKSGTHGIFKEVRTARASTFRVVTRRPQPINADGELVTETPASFTQRRKAVRVFVPV